MGYALNWIGVKGRDVDTALDAFGLHRAGNFPNGQTQGETKLFAITLAGDWIVLVEEKPGVFKAEEIKVVRTVGKKTVIEGLKPGTRVVTRGAFFVQSELAKSGFSVHNH